MGKRLRFFFATFSTSVRVFHKIFPMLVRMWGMSCEILSVPHNTIMTLNSVLGATFIFVPLGSWRNKNTDLYPCQVLSQPSFSQKMCPYYNFKDDGGLTTLGQIAPPRKAPLLASFSLGWNSYPGIRDKYLQYISQGFISCSRNLGGLAWARIWW